MENILDLQKLNVERNDETSVISISSVSSLCVITATK